jgi:hypothetical protein
VLQEITRPKQGPHHHLFLITCNLTNWYYFVKNLLTARSSKTCSCQRGGGEFIPGEHLVGQRKKHLKRGRILQNIEII